MRWRSSAWHKLRVMDAGGVADRQLNCNEHLGACHSPEALLALQDLFQTIRVGHSASLRVG